MTQIRIIAEIGINHDGSADKARALIEAAASAGVQGVKFQYRNISRAYANDARQIGDEILQKEIRRAYLSPAQLIAAARYAQDLNIQAGISFFTPEDSEDFGPEIDCFDFFKIPSVEFTNLPLIKHIESYKKPGLISTGTYTENTVREILSQIDRSLWTPLHCISNYPVGITNPRLGYLTHIQRLWNGSIGYSSHDEYWETCLLALQLGAVVIERHITFDKAGNGLDHSSSSTPDEFAKLTQFAENLPLILAGDNPRIPNQGELINLQNLGRSFYAVSDIPVGTIFTKAQATLQSPRTGLGQEEIAPYLGKSVVKKIAAGNVIDRSAFEEPLVMSDDVLDFARRHKLSLPVRFHDLPGIATAFPLGNFEFHMSFGDIEDMIDVKSLDAANHYSVHLPDYINPTELMDPFSKDASQRAASRRILDRTVAFADALQQRTGAKAPIVGSFSVVHNSLEEFHHSHAELIASYRDRGVDILPQWLPPIAWYFGGAVRLKAFNNVPDVALIKSLQMPVCMDVCHLCMGEKVFSFTAPDVIRELAPLIGHIHIADALGHDGEGMPFGEGDPQNKIAIADTFAFDCVKVIEVWQGHLHQGRGFAQALISLAEQFHDR